MQVLFEQWLSANEDWSSSTLVLSMRSSQGFSKRGSRRWMTRDEIASKYNGCYETADEIISEKVKNATNRAQCVRAHPDLPANKKMEQYLCYDESTETDSEDTVVSSLFECRDEGKGKSHSKKSKRKRSSSTSDSSDDTSESESEDSLSSSESRRKSKKSKKKGKKSKKEKKSKGGRGGRNKKKSKEAKAKAKEREKQKELKDKERAQEKDKQDLRSKAKKAFIYLLHTWPFNFPLPTISCFWQCHVQWICALTCAKGLFLMRNIYIYVCVGVRVCACTCVLVLHRLQHWCSKHIFTWNNIIYVKRRLFDISNIDLYYRIAV